STVGCSKTTGKLTLDNISTSSCFFILVYPFTPLVLASFLRSATDFKDKSLMFYYIQSFLNLVYNILLNRAGSFHLFRSLTVVIWRTVALRHGCMCKIRSIEFFHHYSHTNKHCSIYKNHTKQP